MQFIIDKFLINDPEMDKLLIKKIDEQEDRQNNETSVKANMTEWDMSLEPGFDKLSKYFLKLAYDTSLKFFDKEINPAISSIWGMKYKSGDYATYHHHHPAIWSLVYYPKVDDYENAPKLMFKIDKGENELPITPQPNSVWIFPGSAYHYVEQKEFAGDRYCVAANVHSLNIIQKLQAREARQNGL